MKLKDIIEWLATLAVALVLALTVRTYVAEARWVPSESMLPTLEIGDRLLVEKISLRLGHIERGDILVFRAPAASRLNKVLVKRVIGLPGEKIEIKDGHVYVDGQLLPEHYVAETATFDFKSYVVPKDSYFVMGDNRNNSYDSRFWGAVPKTDIVGVSFARYYPFDRMTVFHSP